MMLQKSDILPLVELQNNIIFKNSEVNTIN